MSEVLPGKNGIHEALFEHASMGILVAASNGKIVMANRFLLKQFGFNSVGEILNQPVEFLIPSRYHKNHTNHRKKYTHQPEQRAMGIGMDLFAVKKNGEEFPVEISLGHYESEEGAFVIAFISDITQRKKIEADVIAQREELEQINKQFEELNNNLEKTVEKRTSQLKKLMLQIEASRDDLSTALNKEKELSDMKSRFVSMASHEFRTPLSTILSSASLLAKYTTADEQEKRDKHIQRIKSSVNNLTGILDEFLAIGKIEDGHIAAHHCHFNIQQLISTICSEMEALVVHHQTIVYTHTGEEMVYLDPSLLRNIIVNLLSNAIKFSHPGGNISVSTSLNKKNVLRISVSDHGIGISEEDQLHLFERFYRAKNATNIQGTGLGLHIVANYVEIMNGKIDWFSELEKGTTFNITFQIPKE
ncbi:MAG TPA: PAS domain-containing sensor histidine kinase [Ferruginibacter sp.]|nr:PAS domain-containing sensor histidine kinase [Ferruginibacter sp.]HRO17654.1 PAS domain-containing sensor histidine kinase [Ferruginibacter sp.]HRQ20666.1 PAS domain-containing sensor histidine kinase [Ferruginibacter sp.]